jgi:hypothetical protein
VSSYRWRVNQHLGIGSRDGSNFTKRYCASVRDGFLKEAVD